MHGKHALTNFSERCRICLADYGSMSEIFDESLQEKIQDLSKCTSVDIKDEQDFPRIICHICLYKLELWHEFKEEFLKSNKLLLERVQLPETPDNVVSLTKRKRSEMKESGEDDPSGDDKKKLRADLSPRISLDVNTSEVKKDVKDEYISEDEPASSKDSFQKDSSVLNSSVQKETEDRSADNLEGKLLPDPAKIKSLSGKRGKNTERRIASTKRWVERKKALIAATGENVSDTDSIASDEVQLSPIQKARAKTNAEKEVEKQKRVARALKNLETNMAGKYGIKHECDNFVFVDTDSDSRTTRSQKLASNDVTKNAEKSPKKEKSAKDDTEKNDASPQTSKEHEVSVVLNEKTAKNTGQKNNKENEEPFKPHVVKTELNVGDATYIVTSTLVLVEPCQSTKDSANNETENVKNTASDENTQEKNTDIIDAVQLRRIHPTPSVANEKKNIERCLNIEVEGTELEPLKQVQLKLADFLEEEMKYRLFGLKNVKKRRGRKPKESMSTLNIQLKGIVEKAIKRNFETSMMNIPFIIPASGTVSPAFVELALRSSKFQPKVLLHRLNITEESRRYRIGNVLEGSERKDLNSAVYPISRKRKHLPPARYNEYVTSGLDSDSDAVREKRQAKAVARNSTNILKPSTARRPHAIGNEGSNEPVETDVVICEVVECDTTTTSNVSNSIEMNDFKTVNRMVLNVVDQKSNETYRCNVCQKSFATLPELEIHSATHKPDNSPTKQNKQKLMRCKRCHEIVEARLVKQHVCRSTKYAHKCYVCNSTFRTEKLLARHLKSHDQSEFKIDVTKIEPEKASNTNVEENNGSLVASKIEDQTKAGDSSEAHVNNANTKKESYTCFVCNKTFTDEEVLKDHLQKHCDDISEGEESTGKEQYQCAICGDSMDSEDALEEHVEKHLFNDEDDNPNLISISGETEKTEVAYSCAQCSEVFDSEMLLEMHMQAHEEEAAIAEWERQGLKTYEYQCMICDEVFGTEEELSEHLDVHNGNVHVCQLCDKPFQSLEDLQNHVATH